MGRAPRPGPQPDTTPQNFPEVPPPSYPQSVNTAWLAESMMQMQATMGELKATTNHLNTTAQTHSTKLDRISHIVFAAGVVLTIIFAIAGFFMNKLWDGMIILLKATH